MCFGFRCDIYRNSSWYFFKYMYWWQYFMFYQDLWGRSPCWPYTVLTLMHMLLCCHRVTDWHVTTPWLTTTMSSFGRCVTETRCLKSLSRKKTSSGGTGALVFHHMAYSEERITHREVFAPSRWADGRYHKRFWLICAHPKLFQTRLPQYAGDPSQDPAGCEMELQRWDFTGKLRFILLTHLYFEGHQTGKGYTCTTLAVYSNATAPLHTNTLWISSQCMFPVFYFRCIAFWRTGPLSSQNKPWSCWTVTSPIQWSESLPWSALRNT